MEKKVYEIKFNSWGVIYVIASSYQKAAEKYENWLKESFSTATLSDWETKSISELGSTKPALFAE